jgi:hypothetical protein
MSRFEIEFLGSQLWLIILLCLILLGLSYLYYRRTTPPLPKFLRWSLMVLRGLAFISLFLALAQPIISYTKINQKKKQMVVLLDRSSSMSLPLGTETEITRLQQAMDLWSGPETAPLRNNLEITTYAFAESLDVSATGEFLARNKTDFGRAVSQVRQLSAVNPPDYLMILSDGRATEGENLPDLAESFGWPIYTIAIGDSSRTDDIALDDIEFNEVIYAGRQTEIKASISQKGDHTGRLQIQLSEGERILTQKSVDPPGDGKIGEQNLTFTPAVPGRMFLNLEVSAGEEPNLLNNRRTFSVRVLKSKLNIMIYSSSLNQEYAFLNRYLKSRDDYEVTSVIDAPGGNRLGERFPNTQEKLNSYDLVIMIDPNLNRIKSHYDRMISYMTDRGGAIMIFMGEQYARSAAGNRLETLSPLASGSTQSRSIRYGKFQTSPDARMIFHPVLKLAETREDIARTWQNQPPFTQLAPIDSVRTGAASLGYIEDESGGSRKTVIAYKRYGAGKILTFAVAPFWHWAFYPVGVGSDASVYREFLSGTVRWLTISDESDRLSFKPVKEIFQNGEEVSFEGSVHDEGFRPIEGGSGDLIIVSGEYDSTIAGILPEPGRPGKYGAGIGVLSPGSYEYHAELYADSVKLGDFNGKFAVDDIDRETAFSDVDWSYLAETADNSGGMFASYNNIQPLIDAIDKSAVEVEETRDIRLWDHLILLIIIIVTLTLEWFIRKRRQLL